jgi:hypothetical protein
MLLLPQGQDKNPQRMAESRRKTGEIACAH